MTDLLGLLIPSSWSWKCAAHYTLRGQHFYKI